LPGTVDDRRAKRLAEDLAESVSGVKDVHNRLRVRHERMDGGRQPHLSKAS
jgi:osmotically-inducible protein OsmY